jgi:hypothetical protein
MGRYEKILSKILDGTSDSNIDFQDLRDLLIWLGFDERVRGSHHIFRKEGIVEKPNIQAAGKSAKSYQIKQIRTLITNNNLKGKK